MMATARLKEHQRRAHGSRASSTRTAAVGSERDPIHSFSQTVVNRLGPRLPFEFWKEASFGSHRGGGGGGAAMARTKQTARKSTGGKQLATKAALPVPRRAGALGGVRGVPGGAVRGHQPVRHPHQARHHHAQGHPARSTHPWREGLGQPSRILPSVPSAPDARGPSCRSSQASTPHLEEYY